MLLLLGFAFLAGIFTVASPCILPVLPAILAAGTQNQKMRPLGVVLGLVISFSFFTLALTAIVRATGLSPNILRYSAIALIAFFGLTMIFPSLSNWFAKMTAPIGSLGQRVQGSSSGFFGGILFGAALGLLWTPCAGPILAAITTLVATSAITWTAVLITLAYSVGAGIPLLLIAYGGSKIIESSRYLSLHSEGIRQFFGALMILFALVLIFHWDMLLQRRISSWVPEMLIENHPSVQKELEKVRGSSRESTIGLSNLGPSPELKGIVKWINSEPLTIEGLRGKVVLIDFWTYSCINCLRTLPYLEKWDAEYAPQGLVIIGVHTPEFEFEKDPTNVAAAVKRLGVEYPVALDNNYGTWRSFQNNYWPAHYLIDKEGNLRMVHFGEGAYGTTENGIRQLLGLDTIETQEPSKITRLLTAETYLGTERGHSYISQISIEPTRTVNYAYSVPLGIDEVGLKGSWRAEMEYIESESDESYLELNYQAKQVYLVLGGSSNIPILVTLDGEPARNFLVDADRKYDVVTGPYGRHTVSLKIPRGVRAYAFTFGDE